MAITYTTKEDVKVYENDTVNFIPANKTLFVNKSTYEDSNAPDLVKVNSTQEVFEHYKPKATINLETASGKLLPETFHFKKLEDFHLNSLIKQSNLLKGQKQNEDYFLEIIRKINQDNSLKKILADKELRAEFLQLIQGLKDQLKEY